MQPRGAESFASSILIGQRVRHPAITRTPRQSNLSARNTAGRPGFHQRKICNYISAPIRIAASRARGRRRKFKPAYDRSKRRAACDILLSHEPRANRTYPHPGAISPQVTSLCRRYPQEPSAQAYRKTKAESHFAPKIGRGVGWLNVSSHESHAP
jgi:hypothetical protein